MVHASYGSGQRMPFGKHRGRLLSDLPADYLAWLASIDLKPFLRAAVRDELSRRGHRWHRGGDDDPEDIRERYPPPVDWQAVVGRARRELALVHHPDRGGDGAVMTGINIALDKIAQLMEVG